jgi:hypothetical protein
MSRQGTAGNPPSEMGGYKGMSAADLEVTAVGNHLLQDMPSSSHAKNMLQRSPSRNFC